MYPAAWRAKNADAVLGTLMDVADERGGHVPLPEVLNLAVRGSWRRVRGSVAFWGGLVIIVLMLYPTLMSIEQIRLERLGVDQWWTAYAVAASTGLLLGLPVMSAVAGWAGARTRIARVVGARGRLLELWSGSWPVLVAALLGYLASLSALAIAVGWPFPAPPHVLVILAQLGAVVAAIAIGQVFGAVLPRVLVIFAAPAAMGAVLALCLIGQRSPISVQYLGLASVPVAAPFLVVSAIGAVAAVFAVAVSALPKLGIRLLSVAAATALVVAIASTGVTPFVTPFFEARPSTELTCSTDKPIVCLWPEQEALFGASVRADMVSAYDRAVELGLPVDDDGPTTAARYALTGYSPDGSWGGSLARGRILNFYASTFIWDYVEIPKDGDGESANVMFAIAILLGVDRAEAWPGAPDPVTGDSFLDPAEVPDDAAALAIVRRWLTNGVDGVRSPN